MGEEGFLLGNVFQDELDSGIKQLFSTCQVHDKECIRCWARYYCGGGCLAQAYLQNGDIKKPHRVSCEMHRKKGGWKPLFSWTIIGEGGKICSKSRKIIPRYRVQVKGYKKNMENFVMIAIPTTAEAACSPKLYCTGFYDSIFMWFLAVKISAIAVIVDGETQFLTASRQEVPANPQSNGTG